MTRRFIYVAVLLFSTGCMQHAIHVAENAEPVLRRSQTMRWRDLNEIEPIAFGPYRVASSNRRKTTTDGRDAFKLSRVRKEGGVDFDLDFNGTTVAKVSARSRRKQKAVRTKLGDLNYSGDDLLDGTIVLASGQEANFAVDGFHSTSVGVKASGSITVGPNQVMIQEVDAPLIHPSRGFAGAEFYLGGQRIGQVLRGGNEHVWVDEQLPTDLQSAVAAMAATLLITQRIDTSDK